MNIKTYLLIMICIPVISYAHESDIARGGGGARGGMGERGEAGGHSEARAYDRGFEHGENRAYDNRVEAGYEGWGYGGGYGVNPYYVPPEGSDWEPSATTPVTYPPQNGSM